MKNTILIILLSIFLVFGCADSGSDSDGTTDEGTETTDTGGDDDGGVTDPGEATETEITKINLAGLDNLVISSGSGSSSALRSVSGSTDKQIYSVVDGQLQAVEMTGGDSLEVSKIVKVKGGTTYKTFFEFTSDTGETKRYMTDADGNTVAANFNPQKSSNLVNAATLQEISSKLYYLNDDNELRTFSVSGGASGRLMSESGDSTGDTVLAEGVEQFAIHSNGEMILDDGSAVNYRETDESLNDLDVPYQDELRGDNWDADASTTRFFLTHGSGFLVKRASDDDFVRYYTKDGAVMAQYAQEIDYTRKYYNAENFPWPTVETTSSLSNCGAYTVQGKEVAICKPNEVFILGDATTDIEEKDLNYSVHAIYGLQIVASSNYLYMYSENIDGTPRKLSREDIFNDVSTPIVIENATTPQTIDYQIAADTLEVSETDVVSFCATKGGESYVVRIENADTASRVIVEALGQCESVVPLD